MCRRCYFTFHLRCTGGFHALIMPLWFCPTLCHFQADETILSENPPTDSPKLDINRQSMLIIIGASSVAATSIILALLAVLCRRSRSSTTSEPKQASTEHQMKRLKWVPIFLFYGCWLAPSNGLHSNFANIFDWCWYGFSFADPHECHRCTRKRKVWPMSSVDDAQTFGVREC